MKHVLLLLSLFFVMGAWAVPTKTATFNFSKPQSLTPSYSESDFNTDEGPAIKVSEVKFTSGDITLSFNDEQNAMGDWLTKHTSYYTLDMGDNSRMVVSGADVRILSITVGKGSIQGGFGPAKGQGGSFITASSDFCCQWTADGTTTDSVSFFVSGSGSGAQFNTVTVIYEPKSDVLTPTSTSIANGATVGSFSSIDLTFGNAISLLSDKTATLTTPDGKTQNLNASASGSTLTLGVSEALTDDGSYSISIPSGMVEDANGYTNAALTYTITVKKDLATFNPTAVSPQEGYQASKSLTGPVTITFDGLIGKVSDEALALNLDGKPVNGVTFKISDDKKSIIGTFNVPTAMTDLGTYTLTIPEGYVHNATYNVEGADRYNKAVTYSWVVSNKKPDSETMKQAKALLAKAGVGYPTTDSEARKALVGLVNAETTPSDDDLKTAMANFYKETNVELPATEKYYKIYGVNDEGKKLYLTYDGSAVKISSSEADAYSFKAEAKGEGKVAFSTVDGKYLHLLTKFDTYTGTSPKNVTSTYDASVNDLSLARLLVAGTDSTKTFGTFSVKGSLGKDPVSSEDVLAYDLLDFTLNSILTNPTYKTLLFNEKVSNAFVFEEGTKPVEESVDIDATLTPSTIKNITDTMTLSFTNISNVTLKDSVTLTVTDADGKAVSGATATIKAQDGSTKDFVISVSGLKTNGSYYVVIPKGAFSFTQNGKLVTSNEVKEAFTLNVSTPTPSDFKHYQYWEKLPKEGGSQAEYPKDYISQYIVLIDRAQTDTLIANPNARIELVEYNNNQLMGYGHFEADPDHTDDINFALKLVWDQPIDMVHVRTTDYSFKIPEGAFGDSNYGKYLKDPSSVKSADCTVNDSFMRTYSVNTTLTGIRDINTDVNAKKVIYDLQGRRVERISKPGLYIVNGKKVLIKK